MEDRGPCQVSQRGSFVKGLSRRVFRKVEDYTEMRRGLVDLKRKINDPRKSMRWMEPG